MPSAGTLLLLPRRRAGCLARQLCGVAPCGGATSPQTDSFHPELHFETCAVSHPDAKFQCEIVAHCRSGNFSVSVHDIVQCESPTVVLCMNRHLAVPAGDCDRKRAVLRESRAVWPFRRPRCAPRSAPRILAPRAPCRRFNPVGGRSHWIGLVKRPDPIRPYRATWHVETCANWNNRSDAVSFFCYSKPPQLRTLKVHVGFGELRVLS